MKNLILAVMLVLSPVVFASENAKKGKHPKHWTFKTKVHKEKHFKGYKKSHNKSASPKVSFLAKAELLPKTGTTVPCATPVENQGQCGSCWDFSLTGTLRDSLACNGPRDPGRLSFNYLLDCATEQSGCDGGNFNAADHLMNPAGPSNYDSWPYTGNAGRCQSFPVAASANASHMLGGDNGPSFKDIAHVISVLNQPVSIDVAVVGAWESYDGGIYNECSGGTSDINHMVIISAYDCETAVDANGNCVFDENGNLPNGVGTYTIKNSWGPDWGGEGGYIRTKATGDDGSKCNAVATDGLYFDVDARPTPPAPTPVPPTPPAPCPSCAPDPGLSFNWWQSTLLLLGLIGAGALGTFLFSKFVAKKPELPVDKS